MKSLLKRTIHKLGYDLVRKNHSDVGRGDFWGDWFAPFAGDLTNSYILNRSNLKKVSGWLDEKTYANSFWGYGVPSDFLNGKFKYSLNHNPHEFTYSDLMVAIGRKLGTVTFLEIGVSAGKNFYQMFSGLENSTLYGMDIEEMNPVLAEALTAKELMWTSDAHDFTDRHGAVVKKIYTLHKFRQSTSNNIVNYLSGDKFNSMVWDRLNGVKFNIIFSDAFHKPESIRDEFEVLKSRNLFDPDNFLMIWDDLDSIEMQRVFSDICKELTTVIFSGRKSMHKLYNLHGTYAGLHKIGLFCSFKNPQLRNHVS